MEREADPFAGLKTSSDEYKVYDSHYEKIGKVDDLIVDDEERVLFLGVKTGFLGTSSTLVPVEIARVNDRRQLVEVGEPADTIKHAPHFGRSEELTAELENHVRSYYGLGALRPSPEHDEGLPGTPDVSGDLAERLGHDDRVDTAPGERAPRDRGFEERTASAGPAERRPGERSAEEEPISERLSEERRSLLPTGGGVTVHRLRR